MKSLQGGWCGKGPPEVAWDNPRLKQGHPEMVAQDHVRVGFEDVQGWRSHGWGSMDGDLCQ